MRASTRNKLRKTEEWANRKTDIAKMEKKHRIILAAIFVVVIGLASYGYYLMKQYELAIMNVYAAQQDNYVQLVLDQINLQSDRSDESIISDIIDTLDSGKTHYWTLSKDENLLFVKNVIETNAYQGVSVDTFFTSDTADDFINNLTLNHVSHETIKLDGVVYVASGVNFEYNGGEYSLCLLTDETVILDNNDFLSTKISMYIYSLAILLFLMIVAMIAVETVRKSELENNLLKSRVELSNQHINRLELEGKQRDSYNTRFNVYNASLLTEFASELKARSVNEGVVIRLTFEQREDTVAFLTAAMNDLDESILRFKESGTSIILLMSFFTEENARGALKKTGITDANIARVEEFNEKHDILDACNEVL